MSSTQVPSNVAQRAPQQQSQPAVTQQQVDAAGKGLTETADQLHPQGAADRATQQENQRREQAAKSLKQRKHEAIQAAKKIQKARQEQQATDVRQGDHVVIDLSKVPEALHTVSMREHLRRLHQAGAHLEAGRAAQVNDTPTGKQVVVETPSANHTVPIGAVTRADLFDDSELESDPSFQ